MWTTQSGSSWNRPKTGLALKPCAGRLGRLRTVSVKVHREAAQPRGDCNFKGQLRMLTFASRGNRRAQGISDPSIYPDPSLSLSQSMAGCWGPSFMQPRLRCHCFPMGNQPSAGHIPDAFCSILPAVSEQHRVACHHFSLKDTMAQSHVTCDLGTLICHHFFGKVFGP